MKLIDISTKVQKSFYNEILSVEDMTDNYIEQVKKLVQDPDKLVTWFSIIYNNDNSSML